MAVRSSFPVRLLAPSSPRRQGAPRKQRGLAASQGNHTLLAPGPSSLARYSGRSERNRRLPAKRAGGRVISRTRCSGDLHNQVLAMPAHLVRQITLTLPSPGVPGEGTHRATAVSSGTLLPWRLLAHLAS